MSNPCARPGCERLAKPVPSPYCSRLCDGIAAQYYNTLRSLSSHEHKQACGALNVADLLVAEVYALDELTAAAERLYVARWKRISKWNELRDHRS